jgi:hypothetical protein
MTGSDDEPREGYGRTSPMRQGTIDVAYDRVRSGAAGLATPWRAIDVFTKNTTYTLDAQLVCTAVLDRASGAPQKGHLFVGAELVGGAMRSEAGRLLAAAHPLPEVGMHAVFRGEKRGKAWFNETSPVVRVVIRQRVIEFDEHSPLPSWDKLTGRRTLQGY